MIFCGNFYRRKPTGGGSELKFERVELGLLTAGPIDVRSSLGRPGVTLRLRPFKLGVVLVGVRESEAGRRLLPYFRTFPASMASASFLRRMCHKMQKNIVKAKTIAKMDNSAVIHFKTYSKLRSRHQTHQPGVQVPLTHFLVASPCRKYLGLQENVTLSPSR